MNSESSTPAPLPIETTRSGDPIVRYAGQLVHSAYDPAREARQWLEAQLHACGYDPAKMPHQIVVMGPGLGYCFEPLTEQLTQDGGNSIPEIHFVEAIPEIHHSALQARIWSKTGREPVCHLLTSDDSTIRALLAHNDTLILRDAASYRFARDQYESLLNANESSGRPLRVLVPTPLYGGSLPAARHSADGWRELGSTVELLDLESFYPMYQYAGRVTSNTGNARQLQNLLVEFLANMIVERAIELKADLVWAVAQTPLTPTALMRLREAGIKSAMWFVEDYRLFPYWKQLCRDYDAFFAIQIGDFHRELRANGARAYAYLPCAANPRVHFPENVSQDRWKSPVSFLGAGYRNRQALFDKLNRSDFKIWGNDWPEDSPAFRYVQEQGRRVTTVESRKIFNATSVNINLHSSVLTDGVEARGSFINPRTFEIAACGAFQLADERTPMRECFSEQELVTFRNETELRAKLDYYLEHEAERKEIAIRARARVLSEHTYRHRMQTALEFLEKHVFSIPDDKPDYLESMLAAAGEDRELLEFLSRFKGLPNVSLDTITDSIELGKGPLGRAEGIFLLMREFRDWGREKGVIS